jgi:hypothetical protein
MRPTESTPGPTPLHPTPLTANKLLGPLRCPSAASALALALLPQWQALQAKLKLVFMGCSSPLASALQLPDDFGPRAFCWNRRPRPCTYAELLLHATLLIGLGGPLLSPTPLESLACSVPVVLPPAQHPFVAQHASAAHFFPVESAESVLTAVDRILSSCAPAFEPAEGGYVKRDRACFPQPSAAVRLMTGEGVLAQLNSSVAEKLRLCAQPDTAAPLGSDDGPPLTYNCKPRPGDALG